MYFCAHDTTFVVFCQYIICWKGDGNLHYRRLRDLREDHDLTQDQLVAMLGMHKTTYTNYEQGKREIPFALVIRLAQLYNVSIDYIAELSNTPSPLSGTNIYQHT